MVAIRPRWRACRRTLQRLEGKRILYLTSGKLPFPMVDDRFAEQVFIGPQFECSKVQLGREWICRDPEHALIDLYLRGKTFDAVVILESDIAFRKRGYCLHRGATMGLLPLVVKPTYIQILSPDAIRRSGSPNWRQSVDLPLVRNELESASSGWIYGLDVLFSLPEGELRQWEMTRVYRHSQAVFGTIEYHMHWKSIWQDAHDLDVLLLPASFQCEYWDRMEELARAPVRVIGDQWSYSNGCADPRALDRLVDPVEYCSAYGFRKIGIVPDGADDGWKHIQRFSEQRLPCELHFYHLRRDSCESMYEPLAPIVLVH